MTSDARGRILETFDENGKTFPSAIWKHICIRGMCANGRTRGANVPQSAEALLTEELPYSCLPYQFTNNKPRGIRNEACVDS